MTTTWIWVGARRATRSTLLCFSSQMQMWCIGVFLGEIGKRTIICDEMAFITICVGVKMHIQFPISDPIASMISMLLTPIADKKRHR
jgi:hypothetical protein